MAAGVAVTLDVPELQMLVEFPGDANGLDFHHRVLWYRVDRSVWIISTPDGDVYEEDYDNTTVIPLPRRGPYPNAQAGQMYIPDNAAVMAQYGELRRQAESLALVRGCLDRPGVVAGADAVGAGQWRVADVDSKRFGEIIPNGELNEASHNVHLQVGDVQKRLHFVGGEIVALELVSNFDEWKNKKRPGLPGGDAGDLRILGCTRLSSGKRQLTLTDALTSMSQQAFDDWPHRGPRATREFLESVCENGGDFATYHASFMRKSGLPDSCAAAHELRNLLQIVKFAISYDQVDCSNLAAIEQAVRRILEIQTAVRRNPKHPTFDAFDYNTRGSVDEVGGARAPGYAEWMAEQQRAEAKVLKNTREWRDEQAAERRRAAKTSGDRADSDDDPAGYGRRMAGRVNEAIGSLNALSNVSVRSIKRGSFDHGLRPGDKPTRPQEAILSRLATNVHESGTCPAGLTPKLCFEEVIKSKDMYSLSQCAVAPYDLALLKVAKTETVPKEATQLLPPTEASYLLHPERHILRSPQDIQTWADANADFHPYWDETLRKDRQLRLELYQILAKKSLLSFRKKISARVGLFFVWKASRKGIRLIVDARMANACHVRPPKTRPGGASALAELDAFLQDSDLAALGEGYGGPGWAWALHFCNCAVEYNMSKALGASQFVKEGLPPPDLRQGPVGSVYVDNIGTFGFLGSAVTKSFDDCVQTLESAGFVLHELDKDSVEVANVGIVVHRYKKEIRHTRKRSWRLYLALKHVLRLKKITCEALRIVIGHLVHYFTLFRPALSVLHHSYKFVYEHLDGRSHSLPGRVKRELRMAVGLIFQIKVDLSAPYADHIYCGDSSTYGYCFQSTPSTAEEQRHLFRYHERWRFVQLEEGVGQGLGSHHAWSADFALPDIAYTRWLCARNAIPFPGGEELEKGSKDFSGGDHLRRFHHVDLVGLVPRLPDSLVDHTRWRTIIQRKWKHNESIHMKEGRVALMTLRREAKKASSHGKRLLTLCDNLSATCAFDKGRAKDLALLVLCRKAAAIQIGTAIRWHLRYVESARNPSDRDSRVFPGDHGHRGSPLSAADATGLKQGFSNHTPPLLSSSCTARGGNPTAVSSRGGTRGEPKDKKQARVAKDRLSKLTDTAPGFLRKAKIRKSSTRTLYGDAWATFLAFCLQTGALCSDKSKFATMSQLDRALESFGESLYLQGKPKYTFDCAIQNCNVEYPAWPTNARLNYPLAKAAKRGWGTLEPGSSREPCPLEVAFWIASDLLARNLLSIAAAVVLCFDTYIRPGKLLELRHCNVIPPARGLSRQYIQWTLLLHQEAQDPSKTGQHNDSLIVGSFEREWIGTLLGHLYKRHSKGVQAFLFDFDLSTFEKERKARSSDYAARRGAVSRPRSADAINSGLDESPDRQEALCILHTRVVDRDRTWAACGGWVVVSQIGMDQRSGAVLVRGGIFRTGELEMKSAEVQLGCELWGVWESGESEGLRIGDGSQGDSASVRGSFRQSPGDSGRVLPRRAQKVRERKQDPV
ncbi:Uncharacterized protein SCF082_LOCUS41845 [Durusdinium trenchii]|uniref:Uncharacterized protein n=1 Tax=Durusdinium trenchii TaxID=1381693 RepID=A0ABP0QNQ7_9DINO